MNVNTAHRLAKLVVILLLTLTSSPQELNGQTNGEVTTVDKSSLQLHIDSLKRRGFLEASYKVKDSSYLIKNGPEYIWGEIVLNGLEAEQAQAAIKKLKGETADQIKLERLSRRLLKKNAFNSGYPFAEASLTVEDINGNTVNAAVVITLNNYIVYDSIDVNTTVISTNYLQNFLNLKYGEPWSNAAFEAIAENFEQLPFVSLAQKPEVTFSRGMAQIDLECYKTPANQFDAIVGIIPQGDKTLITGQADLKLPNLFRSAIAWNLNWQKYDERSQFLNTSLTQLKILKSPVGYQANFNLLKEDSSFLRIDYQLMLNYPVFKKLNLHAGFGQTINRFTASNETMEDVNNNQFRSSDISNLIVAANYNVPLNYPQLKDYFYIQTNTSIGRKTLQLTDTLINEDDEPAAISSNIEAAISVGFQQKLLKRFTIEEVLSYKGVFNEALAQNDLLRLGGLQNLRGYNQNFFFARQYLLLNINYRYFLNNMSSAFIITDAAVLPKTNRLLYSTGLGLDARTKNGWFRLIYALGMESGNKVNFSSAKVHFGYIALF